MKVDVGDGEGLCAVGALFVEDDIKVDFAGTPAYAMLSAEFFFDLFEVMEQWGW